MRGELWSRSRRWRRQRTGWKKPGTSRVKFDSLGTIVSWNRYRGLLETHFNNRVQEKLFGIAGASSPNSKALLGYQAWPSHRRDTSSLATIGDERINEGQIQDPWGHHFASI